MFMVVLIMVLVVVIVALLIVSVNVYNGIVRRDNRCDSAWQTTCAHLERKGELAREICAYVGDHTDPADQMTADVERAYEALSGSQTPEEKVCANVELDRALRHLEASLEAESELARDERYLQLRDDLADVDGKVGRAGATYNECVLSYNNAITTVPGSLIAGTRFRKRTNIEGGWEASAQTELPAA